LLSLSFTGHERYLRFLRGRRIRRRNIGGNRHPNLLAFRDVEQSAVWR
jgi:hypothetical protein